MSAMLLVRDLGNKLYGGYLSFVAVLPEFLRLFFCLVYFLWSLTPLTCKPGGHVTLVN